MFRSAIQFLKLLLLIARRGRFRFHGRNFNEERELALRDLGKFVPQKRTPLELPGIKTVVKKFPLLRMLYGEAAYMRRSLIPHGGHLHAPFYNVAYIRIPKSASTSLSFAMLCTIYAGLEKKILSPSTINYLTDANLRDHVGEEGAVFFTVVRNPFARIVSVYRDFFEQSPAHYIYDDYLFGVLPRTITFPEFVSRVQRIPDRLKDAHFRPQHVFLDYYRRRVLNLIVLKLEKAGELDSFLSIYNLNLQQLNKSPESYDYTTYYDLPTLEKVRNIYEKDLKVFGYEQEYHQLLAIVASAHR